MPRAGSAWFYNLTLDLWLAAGGDNIRKIREEHKLQTVITEVNHNIDNFTLRKTARILVPYLAGKSFTLKIHFAPLLLGDWLIKLGFIRPTFIYRDPRDALLSAYEYGRRVEKTGYANAFSHLDTIEKAISFMHGYMRDWEIWCRIAEPEIYRYEDLLTDYDSQAQRLVNFIGLELEHPQVQEAILKNRPRQATNITGGHFSKGKIGRFRQALSAEQIAICNECFEPYLEKMGYEVY